jgi:hypothetical protein
MLDRNLIDLDTTDVAVDEDGNVYERLEALKGIQGLAYFATCPAGMTASTTALVLPSLLGLGEDFFNTDWAAMVIHNVNSDGNAPEGEVRDITNYVSATGTFTATAFSANAEAGDKVLIIRRELLVVDSIALKTTPTTNSLAYRLSQYLASGDGDWATGQPLPSNTSIVDVIGDFTGPHDGAAQDDNIKASLDLAHTDVDALLAKTTYGTVVRKTVAFDAVGGPGPVGTVDLFTVTGDVRVKLTAICSETLVGAATLECGVAGNTAGIIAQIADATALAVGEIWFDATPTTTLDDDSSIPRKVIAAGQDIILTIAAADITDGTINFVAEYEAISADGAMVAA